MKTCDVCNGRGQYWEWGYVQCHKCHGSGQIEDKKKMKDSEAEIKKLKKKIKDLKKEIKSSDEYIERLERYIDSLKEQTRNS